VPSFVAADGASFFPSFLLDFYFGVVGIALVGTPVGEVAFLFAEVAYRGDDVGVVPVLLILICLAFLGAVGCEVAFLPAGKTGELPALDLLRLIDLLALDGAVRDDVSGFLAVIAE
jgi:hypothetical protein